MSVSAGIRAALFAGLACASCSASPDVVATQHVSAKVVPDASSFLEPQSAIKCQPGQYKGTFGTDSDTDASALTIQLDGTFTFSLVQVKVMGGEFTTLADDAYLQGSDQSNLVTFNATILGGGSCIDGRFKSQLVNGKFYVGGGTPVAFSGSVAAGWYDVTLKGFIGTWDIVTSTPTGAPDPKGLRLHGHWSATLIHI